MFHYNNDKKRIYATKDKRYNRLQLFKNWILYTEATDQILCTFDFAYIFVKYHRCIVMKENSTQNTVWHNI